MKRRHFITVFLLLCFSAAFAQQITIEQDRYPSGSSYYFDNRFADPYPSRFDAHNLSLYKKTGVKTVEVLDAKGNVQFMLELDTAGKVVRRAYQYHYFVITETRGNAGDGHTTVKSYLQKGKVVRIDSTFSIAKEYMNGDTVMRYIQVTRTIFESGELINQRNKYFNERYLNKPYTPSGDDPFEYPGQPQKEPKSEVLLTKTLRTDYDSTLHFYSSQVHHQSFYAKAGNKQIPKDSLFAHFFRKEAYQRFELKAGVDGADFEEPREYHEEFRCGSSYARERDEHYYNSYGYKTLPNGLYETYFHHYYPPDPDAKKPEKDEKKGAYHPPGWTPRKSEPVVTTLYTFRYTYF